MDVKKQANELKDKIKDKLSSMKSNDTPDNQSTEKDIVDDKKSDINKTNSDDKKELNNKSDNVDKKTKEKSELESTKEALNSMTDLCKRTQADFMNYKSRVAKEKENTIAYANEKIMKKITTVLDNFELAFNALSTNETDSKVAEVVKGFELIYSELFNVLESEGLSIINPKKGDDFDPYVHQALISVEDKELGDNKIVEVLQKGYKLKSRVIRTCKVKISKN